MTNTPSDADIEALAQQHLKAFAQFTGAGEVWFEGEVKFARAIEAEVRKQDTELIRQMLEALETCDSADGYNGPYQFHDDKAVEAAITAARARLGEKT